MEENTVQQYSTNRKQENKQVRMLRNRIESWEACALYFILMYPCQKNAGSVCALTWS